MSRIDWWFYLDQVEICLWVQVACYYLRHTS